MRLTDLVSHLDSLLGHGGAQDYPGAFNGLQVENEGTVSRVAVAVDAHIGVLEAASAAGADLLIVHHGLAWGPLAPVTGATYRKLRHCFAHNLAVYASHLPLDAHADLGNTAGLCTALGLEGGEPWFEERGHLIGRRFTLDWDRQQLAHRLETVTGRGFLLPWGPERVGRLGVVTGGGGGEIGRVAREVDTFITGEGPHWTDGLARDLGVNLIYGGHYATEIFGVRALGTHVAETFGLPWTFLDLPSGL